MRILIVDDEPLARARNMQELLRSRDITVALSLEGSSRYSTWPLVGFFMPASSATRLTVARSKVFSYWVSRATCRSSSWLISDYISEISVFTCVRRT